MLRRVMMAASGSAPIPGWPAWGSVSSLLYCDGTDGSTSFPDAKGLAWTGNNAEVDTAQSVFGGASALFNGANTSRIQTNSAGSEADLIGGDFTIAAFVRPIDSGVRIFSTGGTVIGWNSTNGIHTLFGVNAGNLYFQIATGTGTPKAFNSTLVIPNNAWTFVTCSWDHSAGVAYLSAGGTVQASSALSGVNRPSGAPFAAWGKIPGGNDGDTMNGHIDHALFCKGLCFYTADFTPPSSPLVP